MNLPEEFLNRMRERLGESFPAFLQSYRRTPVKGVRVNTLKLSAERFAEGAPFPVTPVPWEKNAFYVEEAKAGGWLEHAAGLYYCQEPSATSAVGLARSCKTERVLDLCAAPGGKTTQLAAQTAGKGVLIANEIDAGRAKILSQNVERLGVKNCAVTNAKPAQIAAQFPEYFDLVLVDAPCSGEGMFLKEPEAIPHWSVANVALCAARQKEILEEAAKTVAGGGRLLYSTCTFAEEEDEWQIERFLKDHPEFALAEMKKIYPHEHAGEGHFAALLEKREGERRNAKPYPVRRNLQANRAFAAFAETFFKKEIKGEITTLDDGRMYLVPAGMPAIGARILRLGVELGEFDGRIFKPAHALAMSLQRAECAKFVSLSREEGERYLRGETFATHLENGWCVVGFGDFPLGLGKAVNGVLKNHCPKGLRKN